MTYDEQAVAAAIAKAKYRLSSQDGRGAQAAEKYEQVRSTPWSDLDVVSHWAEKMKEVAAAREALREAQRSVRLLASAEVDEACDAAVAARDEARRALHGVLKGALALHEERQAEAQLEEKREEEERVAQRVAEVGTPTLSEWMRLEWLRTRLLRVLEDWMGEVVKMEEERDELARVTCLLDEGGLESARKALTSKHEEWLKLTDELEDAENAEKKAAKRRTSAPEAADQAKAAVREARRAAHRAERQLHSQRVELTRLASAHMPELLEHENLLKVGVEGIDGEDEVREMLRPELDFGLFELIEKLSPLEGARHVVWRASFPDEKNDAIPCVLKSYVLNDKDKEAEWKALVKEVKLLRQLANCPYVADVQAVFMQDEDHTYTAWVQLPYYNGGDLLRWLREAERPMAKRKVILTHLAHALQYIHERGFAHGDIKLENVLIATDGEHATAHLADFESARQQRRDGTRTMTRLSTTTGGGNKYTDFYVAPEILLASNEGRARDAKPTPAGDMFSYGICCLFACCLPRNESDQLADFDRFQAEGRKLTDWSRAKAGASDTHLAPLLENLLVHASTNDEALDRRWDAQQTLRHPFLDTFEAIELAQREAEAVELARQAQERESEEEKRRLEAEATAQREAIERMRQRSLQQMRRRQEEFNADAARREAELRAERRANEAQARQLQAERDRLERQEAEVAQSVAAARQQASRLAAKQREIAAAEASLQREDAAAQARLATLHREQQELERGLRRTRDEHTRKTSELDRIKRELAEREKPISLSSHTAGRSTS